MHRPQNSVILLYTSQKRSFP